MDNRKYLQQLGNAIWSLNANWKSRDVSDDLLDDIESDLEYALKAIRKYRDNGERK